MSSTRSNRDAPEDFAFSWIMPKVVYVGVAWTLAIYGLLPAAASLFPYRTSAWHPSDLANSDLVVFVTTVWFVVVWLWLARPALSASFAQFVARTPVPNSAPSASSRNRLQAYHNGIFISYRRADTGYVAGRVRDMLESKLSGRTVFMDVDAIPFGIDFRRYIHDIEKNCDVLITLIGPNWQGGHGNTARLRNPSDWVRLELECALEQNMPVIPVLVQGATMPTPNDLPESLQAIAYRNAVPLRADPDFHRDMARVVAAVVEAASWNQKW